MSMSIKNDIRATNHFMWHRLETLCKYASATVVRFNFTQSFGAYLVQYGKNSGTSPVTHQIKISDR